MKRVSIRDIAREAGVSPITASRALRNLSNVLPETAERIQKIAKELGYVPDPALTALAAHRTSKRGRRTNQSTVALLRPVTESTPAGQVVHELTIDGVIQEAKLLGYKVESLPLGSNAREQKRTEDILIARGIRGVLFAPGIIKQELHLNPAHFSCVLINHSIRGTGLHAVRNDQFQMAMVALKEVLDRGSKRILVFGGAPSEGPSQYRALAAMTYAHLVFPERSFQIRCLVGEKPILTPASLRMKPDAVLSVLGVIDWPILEEAGLYPGRTIRYIAINAEIRDGFCAAVSTNRQELGRAALRQLHAMLLRDERGVPKVRQIIRVDGSLVYGKSLELDSDALTLGEATADCPAESSAND